MRSFSSSGMEETLGIQRADGQVKDVSADVSADAQLLWNYMQPPVVDFVSILRDLGNPISFCLVGTKSSIPVGRVLPGDLMLSPTMSSHIRERQSRVGACWCAMGWRHSVSAYWMFRASSDSAGEDAQSVQAGYMTGNSCFVSFSVSGLPETVREDVTASVEAASDDFYGCVEQHDVFGDKHTCAAVLCRIPPQGLQAFVRTLMLNLNARHLEFSSLLTEIPTGWSARLVDQWYEAKSSFVDASHGDIILPSAQVRLWRRWCNTMVRFGISGRRVDVWMTLCGSALATVAIVIIAKGDLRSSFF